MVFQSGLGDGLAVWSRVQSTLPTGVQSVTISRPGYGGSPAFDGERSPCATATLLRDRLAAWGLRPPYVLVGHSLGGLYQYAFLAMYPDEVAGIVMLEPTHPDHWQRLRQRVPVMAAIVRTARASPLFSATMRREFDDQSRCLGRLPARGVPAIPARLLVHARYAGLEAGEFERMSREQWTDWTRLLRDARLVQVERTGHYLQRDRPDAVVAAIAEILGDARLHAAIGQRPTRDAIE